MFHVKHKYNITFIYDYISQFTFSQSELYLLYYYRLLNNLWRKIKWQKRIRQWSGYHVRSTYNSLQK